jgi:diadenosine tetraphosphate (Ap4A) HIT family hydrolase
MKSSERLQDLYDGKNPRLVLRMRSGFAVMAENQFLRGYCLLLAYPEVEHLTDLSEKGRVTYLEDMALLGEAVMRVTECKRVNYAMYGNIDPFLHAHIWPRYDWEVPEHATIPPLSYPLEIRTHEDTAWSEETHATLQDQIRINLSALLAKRGHADYLIH